MRAHRGLPFALLLIGFHLACGSDAPSTPPLEIRLPAPPRLAAVEGMTAKVEISDVGTFDLTVAADGSASGEIRDVPVGSRNMTIRYFKSEIILAEINRSLDLAAGQRVEVKITPADFKYPDSDGNGLSNLDEILATKPTTTIPTGGTATGTAISGGTTGTSTPKTAPKLVPVELRILGAPLETTSDELFYSVDLIIRNDGDAKATSVSVGLSPKPIDTVPISEEVSDGCARLTRGGSFAAYGEIKPGQSSGGGGFAFVLSKQCPTGPKVMFVLIQANEGNWSGTVTIQIQAE